MSRGLRTGAVPVPCRARRSVVVLATTAAVLVGCSGTGEPELALMDEPAAAEDALPPELADSEVRGTRLVADLDGARVWAGRADPPEWREADAENWCVVLLLEEGDDWVAGSSCATSARFAREGNELSTGGASVGHMSVRLVPDGYDAEPQAGWERVADNLLVEQ